MAKQIDEVASLLSRALDNNGGDIYKMPWSEFYELSDLKALKSARWDALVNEAYDNENLILGWGTSFALLARDS